MTAPDAAPGGEPPAPAPPAAPMVPALPPLDSGWTPDRQVRFLEAIAEGQLVRDACRAVGLTPTAAYSFRRRANGATFALGWAAANLHARERLADSLLERAVDGQVETITRADGTVIQRHRHDNRLGLTMLARLDRLAAADRPAASASPDAAHAPDAAARPATDPAQAARAVAAGFETYLDLIARDAGPARAALFVDLAARDAAGDALAQADRRLRAVTPSSTPAPPADADAAATPVQPTTMTTAPATAPPPGAPVPPDPADRAGWTATDWARAEAAGLLRFATPPAPAGPAMPPGPPPIDPATVARLMQTERGRATLLADALARYGDADPAGPDAAGPAADAPDTDTEEDDDIPVVWREFRLGWRTTFPPPAGFAGTEEGEFGDPEYVRSLSWDEQEAAERFEAAEPARLAAAAARDAWFAGGGAPVPLAPSDPSDTPDPSGAPPAAAPPSTLSDHAHPPPALRDGARAGMRAGNAGLFPDSDTASQEIESLGEDIALWSRSADERVHRLRATRHGTHNPVADTQGLPRPP